MKLHYLLCAFAIVMVASCKKHDKITLATPENPAAPAPPTKDFREKYVGSFNVTKIHWDKEHPSGQPVTGTKSMYTGILQISYKITDSIQNLNNVPSTGKAFNQPALSFVYGNSTQLLVGVDTMGRLFYKPQPNTGNSGGFITTDSIFHTWAEWHISNSYDDTLCAGRQ